MVQAPQSLSAQAAQALEMHTAHAHSSGSARATTKNVAARRVGRGLAVPTIKEERRGSPHDWRRAGDVRPSFWPGASRATKLCKPCLEHVMARALVVPTPIQTLLRCRSRLIGDGPRRSPLTPRATTCMTLSSGAPIASQAAPYSRSAARPACPARCGTQSLCHDICPYNFCVMVFTLIITSSCCCVMAMGC
jgi:hypothetical protein